MSRFRVENARFRILKGGKIGLSLSIALLGMVVFSPINLYSQTFFDTAPISSTLTAPNSSNPSKDISVEKLEDQNLSSTATYTENVNPEDIIFKPNKVESSFIGVRNKEFSGTSSVTISTDGTVIGNSFDVLDGTITDSDGHIIKNNDSYYYENYSPSKNFTVILATDAVVNDIKKESSIYHKVSSPNSYTTSSENYTANIIMSGNNTIAGITNLGSDGNINIQGDVEFQDSVTAGSIDMDTTQTATFKKDVNLSDKLTFKQDGIVNLKDNFTGNITTDSGNKGTININGSQNQTITGDISNLKNLNVTNANNTTVSGNISATNTDILNNSTLNISNGKTITSIITSSDKSGNLTLLGSGTVNGTVGDSTNSLNSVNAGTNGSSSTFNNNIFATNTNITGTGTVNLNGNLSGTNLNFQANGVVNSKGNITADVTGTTGTLTMNGVTQTVTGNIGNITNLNISNGSNTTINGNINAINTNINNNSTLVLSDNSNINSTITTNANNTGTITFSGDSFINGIIGTNSNKLANINAGETGSIVDFNNDIFVTNTNVTGTGTVNLNGNLSGTNLDFQTNGTVNSKGNITANIIGATGTLKMNGATDQTITGNIGNIANFNIDNAGNKVTVTQNINATNTNISSSSTLNSKGNITSNINGATANSGTLTMSGTNQTITGNIGNTNSLNSFNINSGTTIVSGNVNATNTAISSGATLNSKGNITSNINGATANSGILTMSGTNQTITGNIGNTNSLNQFNINSGTTTVSGNVNATNTNISTSSTLNSKGNIVGNVNGAATNSGTLTMSGTNQTITGNIGNTNSLNQFNINSGTTTVSGNVNATNTNILNNSTLNISNGKTITSTITSSDKTGNLRILGSGIVDGTVGDSTNSLNSINAGVNGSTVDFNNNIFATNTNVTGTGTINLNGNLSGTNLNFQANGVVNSIADIRVNVVGNSGTLNMNGANNQNIIGNVGNIDNLNLNGGKTVVVNGDINSKNTNINSNSTLDLVDGKNINSTINGNSGTLNLLGSSTINKEIQSLKNLNVNADSSNSTFKDLVNSTNISSSGTGSSTFEKDTTTTNLNVNNGTMTFNENLNATNTTIGAGKLNLDANLTGTNINFTATNGELNLSDDSNVTATITANSNNKGNIKIAGDSIISGNIGTSANKIKDINIDGANNKTVNLKDDVNAIKTTVKDSTVNFNQNSGNTNTNLVFSGSGTANLYEGITGDINFAGNNAIVNVKDSKNIAGNIETSTTNNSGIVNFEGDGEVTGTIGNIAFGIKELNVNTKNEQDKDSNGNILPNHGLFLHRDIYADRINLQNNATLIMDDGANITNTNLPDLIVLTTDKNNTGNIIFKGTSTISGEIGEDSKKLESITAGANNSTVTFNDKVYVKDLNYSGNGEVILGGKDASNEAIKGNIDFNNNVSTLTLNDGVNLDTANTTFKNASNATLKFDGDSTISGVLGGNSSGKSTFDTIEAGKTGKTVTFQKDLYANNLEISEDGIVNLGGNFTGTNLNYKDDGVVTLADKKAINSNITTNDAKGTLNLLGDSSVNGTVGTKDDKLKEVNSSTTNKTSTLNGDTFAYDLNVGAGTLNLNANFTGDNLNFKDNGVVNLADNKKVDSKIVNATANDNQGTLNIIKNAEFTQEIGQIGHSLKEINGANGNSITTFKADVFAQNLNLNETGTINLGGNFTGETIDFKDDAILNIANNKNITSSIVAQDEDIGEINLAGSTIISGDIADSLNKIRAVKLNGKNSNSTFEGNAYVKDLDLNEKLALNLNGNLQGQNLNYNANATVNLADDKNIDSKINTKNNGEGTLNLLGSSTINKEVGSDTNRLKEISAGQNGSNSTFKDNVYAEKTTIKDNGVVNFEEDLYSTVYFAGDGVVNIDDEKAIISKTQPFVTTIADGVGSLNYKGATTLTNDIGSKDKRLNSVNFASDTNKELTQELGYNVYAKNTIIGNGNNKVTLDFIDDITFAGNLTITKDATLNIKDKKVDVKDNIKLSENSILNFDVQTTDLSSGSAVVGGKSGQIRADSLTMEDDARFNIAYDGTWEGAGQYNLVVTQNDITTPYRATEKDGRVKDNSIIDSTVEVVGKNLVLKADRTTDGEHKVEDLYIVKSQIGEDYSNGASQSLAKLANEKPREGALAQIIRDMEYLEDGQTITPAKKQEMIEMQRKLAPNPSGVVTQNIKTATDVNKASIKGRLNELRTSNIEDSIQAYENRGISSGDSYSVGDSTLWLKTTASKTKQDTIGLYEGFDTKSYGFVAGLDKNIADSSIIGLSASYIDTNASQNLHDTDTTTVGLTLYGSKEFELGYIEAQTSYMQHSSDTSRTANSGNLTSKVKADELNARVESGVHIPVDNGAYITPFAAVEYSNLKQKGYTEKGTPYQNDALKVDKFKQDRTTAEVGIKATSRIELDNALILPQVSFSVAKDFGSSNRDIKAQFVGGGDKFVTPARELDDMMYKVGAGVETRISNNTKLRLDLNYDRSKDGKFEGYSGNVTLGVSF